MGLSWREAKGKQALNARECAALYDELWLRYIEDHPNLKQVLVEATGLSDMFGKEGNVCQADTLWRLRATYKKGGA